MSHSFFSTMGTVCLVGVLFLIVNPGDRVSLVPRIIMGIVSLVAGIAGFLIDRAEQNDQISDQPPDPPTDGKWVRRENSWQWVPKWDD